MRIDIITVFPEMFRGFLGEMVQQVWQLRNLVPK